MGDISQALVDLANEIQGKNKLNIGEYYDTLVDMANKLGTSVDEMEVIVDNINTKVNTEFEPSLNRVQSSVVELANRFEEKRLCLVREKYPSGFIKIDDPITNNEWINKIELEETIGLIYGYRGIINEGTTVDLPAPPAYDTEDESTWERKDMIFYEMYFEEEQLAQNDEVMVDYIPKFNIRVQADVEDMTNCNVKGMAPSSTSTTFSEHADDHGLYVAEDNTASDNGKVYAIPMYLVHRRNDGSYSVVNKNGGTKDEEILFEGGLIYNNGIFTFQDTLNNSTLDLSENDCLYALEDSSKKLVIDSIEDDDSFRASTINWDPETVDYTFRIESTRPDRLYSNVIYNRDITLMAKEVLFRNETFRDILDSKFDEFLRGNVSKNKELIKYIQGVPKLDRDDNTVFYASLDGELNAEIGGSLDLGTGVFDYMPTGMGYRFNGDCVTDVTLTTNISTFEGTVEFAIDLDRFEDNGVDNYLLTAFDNSYYEVIGIYINGGVLHVEINGDGNTYTVSKSISDLDGYHFIRANWRDNSKLELYIDRDLQDSVNYFEVNKTPDRVLLANNDIDGTTYASSITISDVRISRVNRGNTFSKLPVDIGKDNVITGPSFNNQRQIFSNKQIVGRKDGFARAGEVTSSRGITTQVASIGNWTQGDQITVQAMGNEIISGAINQNTIYGKVIDVLGDYFFKINDVTGLEVGDEFRFVSNEDDIEIIREVRKISEITEINDHTNLITFDGEPISVDVEGYYVVEVTSSDSTPEAVYMDGSNNLVEVAGSWSGLGTREAAFIVGDNPGLGSQDIQIGYSLLMKEGQSYIDEILEDVYTGEFNGFELVENNIDVWDDYTEKLRGRTTECPHIVYDAQADTQATNLTPDSPELQEMSDDQINSLKIAEDENNALTSTDAANLRPEHWFTFDIQEIVEDKFGNIPKLDKNQWLVDNITELKVNWSGYGEAPNRYRADLAFYSATQDDRMGSEGRYDSHGADTHEVITLNEDESTIEILTDDNKIHVVAWTDSSSDFEISSLYTDYINIEITLRDKDDHIKLSPKNNHRLDKVDGNNLSGILFVRPETKEIQTYFEANEEDEIVLFGSYKPKFDRLDTVKEVTILSEKHDFLVSDISSSEGHKAGEHHWKHILDKVRNDSPYVYGELGYSSIPFAVDSKDANTNGKVKIDGDGPVENFIKQYSVPIYDKPYVGIARYLVEDNGELKIWVFSQFTENGELQLDRSGVSLLIPVNKLVKDVESVVREGLEPTAWRTPSEYLAGYVDENGDFIITYQ